MSGGIFTSVKGPLILQRATVALGTVNEIETITSNFTSAPSAADSVPETSMGMASPSCGLSICDGNIPCLPMLSSAAKQSVASYGDRIHEDSENQPHNMPSTLQTEGEILLSPNLKSFVLSELKAATQNFRHTVGDGFGPFGLVFKGHIDENSLTAVKPYTGMVIAVKWVHREDFLDQAEWLTEIHHIGKLCHPNLVKLIGYCLENDHRLLVYEFFPPGSLDNYLFRRNTSFQPLSWDLRLKIALGAAKGLEFLHSDEAKVIYRDFRTSNVLLDSHYNVKLFDLSLAKDRPAGDRSHDSTRTREPYYAAPEYLATGQLTTKTDVYSFGVFMLEMLCGRRAVDKNRPIGEHSLVEWARPHLASKRRVLHILDDHIEGQCSVAEALKAANLAFLCLSLNPKFRPNMSDVVKALEQLQGSIDMKGL